MGKVWNIVGPEGALSDEETRQAVKQLRQLRAERFILLESKKEDYNEAVDLALNALFGPPPKPEQRR